MTCASSMQEAGHPKSVLWDNPEEWGGEGIQDVGTHVHLWLIHGDAWRKQPRYGNYPTIKIKK